MYRRVTYTRYPPRANRPAARPVSRSAYVDSGSHRRAVESGRPYRPSASASAVSASAVSASARPIPRTASRPQPSRRQPSKPAPKKPKKIRVKRDYTLLIFEAFGRVGALFALGFSAFRDAKRYRETVMVFGVILAALGGFLAYNMLTKPNALDVYLNGESLGIMRWDRGPLDPNYLKTHVLTRLASQYEAEILPADEISASPVRAGRNAATISFDAMVSNLIQNLEFYVYGAIITVNGDEAAMLSNIEAADGLLREITLSFHGENVIDLEIVEDVKIHSAKINKNDLMTRSQAYNTLITPRPVQMVHTVSSGESLYTIAGRYGMLLPGLLTANPNIIPSNFLQEGQLLVVVPNIPIISVRTLESLTFDEPILPPIEHRPTSSLPQGTQRQVQEGRAGISRTTAAITRINNKEISREVLTREVIHSAVPQIIEIGNR